MRNETLKPRRHRTPAKRMRDLLFYLAVRCRRLGLVLLLVPLLGLAESARAQNGPPGQGAQSGSTGAPRVQAVPWGGTGGQNAGTATPDQATPTAPWGNGPPWGGSWSPSPQQGATPGGTEGNAQPTSPSGAKTGSGGGRSSAWGAGTASPGCSGTATTPTGPWGGTGAISPSGSHSALGTRRIADTGYQPLSTDSALASLLASTSETPISKGTADLTSPNCLPRGGSAPAWLITPRLEVDEIITDNVRQTPSHRTGDLISVVIPGINITGDTQKLKLNLDYAPAIQRNVWAPDQNRIDQNLSFSSTGIFVPDVFSVDSRASVTDESIEGARGTTSSTFIPNSQRTQAILYSVAPHVQERFLGGAAQADFLYRFTQEDFSGNTGASSFGTGLSNSIEHDGHFSIGTGDELERLNVQLVTGGTYSDNSNQLLTFSRLTEVLQTKYALSRVYTLIAEGGYERLVYPQSSSISYTGVTWNVGGEVHPDPTSYLSLLYGKRDGFLGFNGSARYDITASTSLFAAYSDSTETTQSAVAQGLSAQGTLPINTPIVNPNFPLQNDIFHSKALKAGVENSVGINRFSALLDYEIRNSLLHLEPNDTLVSGYVTWNHEFSELSDASFTLGYSRETINQAGTTNAGMQYNHSFTETLKGSVRYDFVLRTSSVHTDSFLQNAITLSLRQSF